MTSCCFFFSSTLPFEVKPAASRWVDHTCTSSNLDLSQGMCQACTADEKRAKMISYTWEKWVQNNGSSENGNRAYCWVVTAPAGSNLCYNISGVLWLMTTDKSGSAGENVHVLKRGRKVEELSGEEVSERWGIKNKRVRFPQWRMEKWKFTLIICLSDPAADCSV